MNTKMKTNQPFKFGGIGAMSLLGLLVTGCGSQQFVGLAQTQQTSGPGAVSIAPKIDVVLVEDDTGRIQDQYSSVTSAITNSQNGFIQTLDSEGWNYRFATVRLTTYSPVTQAMAGKQDPDWGSLQWQAPYPGACTHGQSGCTKPVDQLPMSLFSTLAYGQAPGASQYAGFLQPGQATNQMEGAEPGFLTSLQNFQGAFTNSAYAQTGTGDPSFFRPDALLAVVLVGTGNDTSFVNFCHRADGVSVPCEQVTNQLCGNLNQAQPTGYPIYPANNPGCGSEQLSFNYYVQQFQALKPNPQQVKFFSAVASFDSASSGGYLCAGGYATAGTRYQNMAQSLGGKSYDVCQQPLSTILPDIAQNLTSTALSYQQDYIVLSQQPNPATINVVENINGASVPISQDANNGWTYVGMTTQYLIDYPINLNQETGYMIELHGSAVLTGSDSAAVTFNTPGGNPVSQGN